MKLALICHFNFRLPHDKVNAIEASAFGTVAKLFLLYDSEWWPSHISSFDFLYPNSTEFQYTKEEAEEDWTRWVLSAFRLVPLGTCECKYPVSVK